MAPRCSILIVEDDAGIRHTMAECLELEGYPVRLAASGSEAFAQIARGGLPSLVLLDMVMPAMTGQEVLALLRSDPATVKLPVVIMTAAVPMEASDFPGADGLLAKPFELAELLDTVARWCGPPPQAISPSDAL
jgi:two-component system, chemotaxis family, chemotaxis protein CheY